MARGRTLGALLVACLHVSLCSLTGGGRGERSVSWAVKLDPGAMTSRGDMEGLAKELAEERGLEFVGRVDPFPNVFEFKLSHKVMLDHSVERGINIQDEQSIEDALHNELSGHPSVKWVSKQVALKRTKREFSDPAFNQQWHLVNRLERGHDTNVSGVWKEGVNGAGVTVAVVDDGVERLNPDLSSNYDADGSYDYNDKDSDPSPNLKAKYDNSHGTKCAGLIAAGTNDICGVGVAYGAKVSGIRMLDGTVTDILEGKSFIYKAHINWIYSCSWGPEDDGKTVEAPGYVAKEAMELAIEKGRYGYGNVFVFASGNGGVNGDNCNYDGYANSIFTITIGAVDEMNNMPYYAELCSAMLGVTYSNGHSHGDRMVVTTDSSIHTGCTHSFSGTSAAAPIAAGMIALMLQARNCLTWRDVQHILVYTAVMVDASHAQWAENAAGFYHSNQHGFGLLDAYRMTRVAGVWPLVPPSVVWSSGVMTTSYPLHVQSYSPAVLSTNVTKDDLPGNLSTLEHTTVTLSLTHTHRGLLSIFLISPHGTNSTLATPRKQDKSSYGLKDWTFSTVKFWAESPIGQWTLIISQSHANDNSGGTVSSWTLTFYGSAIDTEGVQQRQRLVEDAVAMPTWTPLACPPLPAHPEELHLADLESSSLPIVSPSSLPSLPPSLPPLPPLPLHLSIQWKKFLLVIAFVLTCVLLIHCVICGLYGYLRECGCERVKVHRRMSSLPPVKYARLEYEHGDGEEVGVSILQDQLDVPEPAMLPLDTTGLPSSHDPCYHHGNTAAVLNHSDTIHHMTHHLMSGDQGTTSGSDMESHTQPEEEGEQAERGRDRERKKGEEEDEDFIAGEGTSEHQPLLS